MIEITINYLAALTAAIASMAIGAIWYSSILFGKPWMRMVGMQAGEKPKGAGRAYAISFLAAIITAYVLAHMIAAWNATTAAAGTQAAFWLWLGFVATTLITQHIFSVKPQPWGLYAINATHYLASLLAMGAILASWA